MWTGELGYEKRLEVELLMPRVEFGVGEDGGNGEYVPGSVTDGASRLYISSYNCCKGSVLPEVAEGDVDDCKVGIVPPSR